MVLAVRTMGSGAAFLRHQLSACALSQQTGIKKAAFSTFSHFGFPSLQSSSQSSSALVSRVNIPRIAPQLAIQFRFFSSQKGREEETFLHFPAQDAIVAYLTKHPLTNNPYLTEKKIIETVSKFFADQDKAEPGVDMGVMLSLYDLNEKLGLPQMALMTIQLNLTQALKDCANGKPIEVEKKNEPFRCRSRRSSCISGTQV